MADATVKAVFAGDSKNLERTFDRVGASAKEMGSDFDTAQTKTKELGRGLDDARESFDTGEQRIVGFRDSLTGTADVMEGFRTGNVVLLATGFADLASSMSNFILPTLKRLWASLISGELVTKSVAAAQAALNAVMSANPIGLVVLALAALVGGFILAWKHSETFRDIVRGAFDGVKSAAQAVWDFIKTLPDKIGGIGRGLVDIITWPFRTSFNMVSDMWNRTIGGVGFEVPDWVPGVGGKGWSFPRMPRFHTGGVVPGVPGTQVPVMALAGETISRPGAAPTVIQLVLDGRVVTEVVHDGLLAKQRRTPLGLAS